MHTRIPLREAGPVVRRVHDSGTGERVATRQLSLFEIDGPAGPPSARSGPRRRWQGAVVSAGVFLTDRALPVWDAGQPLRAEESVSGRIGQFHPSQLPETVWTAIGPLVRGFVEAAAPATPTRASALMNVVTQHLAWCSQRGISLDAEVVFRPDIVERFVAVGCEDLSSGTRANYRSQLRTVAEAVLGPDGAPTRTVAIRKSDPDQPYTSTEQAAMIGWARGLPTPLMRHSTQALLAVGLGAGLANQDLVGIVGTDITDDGAGLVIAVPGPRPRQVPVLGRWGPPLRELAELCGSRPVFQPNRTRVSRRDVGRFLENLPTTHGPRLSVQRLRVTWIVEHLTAGTNIPALRTAAGVDDLQLARYMRFIPATSEAAARAALRAGLR